jgi:hypothetical protein
MSDEDDDTLLVASITIERRLDSDGEDGLWTAFLDGQGDRLPLIEVLGMLRLAEDTAIREAMGETPEDEDDD